MVEGREKEKHREAYGINKKGYYEKRVGNSDTRERKSDRQKES